MGKMTLAQSYPRILDQYLNYAIFYSKECKRILKTDLFNEAEGKPIPGGIIKNIRGDVYGIDINRGYVKTAKAMGINAQYGDIRKLPFEDGFFDIVFDFSTIDHVKDYRRVILEYSRVLKPGGMVLVVYWSKSDDDFSHMNQLYFGRYRFEHRMRENFKMRSLSVLFEDGDRELKCFVGIKGGVK